ncbi:MAG: hypothetical protein UR39_C0005G0017 [Candidatus Woesebacteria bacterium GW2011_GWA1_33_30]|uniref:Uncharacterized protein n=1 Tax=Candidatus Woesebacteria bacterium GW2011_GWA2_33_28 TaxID=1618561 RepID=A0A0F9ZSM0_9BACT|nr:MAG: hypothetical protein UR38_C0005G0017 [Candidatus Woesebacteria bacterium GW2011_GWA2_33_28]KKP48135.1 MAG: hypothetical protein UR39_C0005G0017 [Candidatus Woesebacteria bacterium GW2011_GWA1_33_30]KKP49377.1 MAG: hypothetical protein UR40_C0006G0017 [Microgenomates group bacterium GW2011_GWC1_33_32]KKP52103.1 MAG: hypothetical protein UR44_C0004G0017 [Candidatus Woesebacteria bacterium GW2011_GWB1_33_38]KKP57578.1 MAG: hypothetical protein UR48_C0014G0007 [Microgenomates group bacteriu
MKIQILNDQGKVLSENVINTDELYAAGVALGIGANINSVGITKKMVDPVLKPITEVNLSLRQEGGKKGVEV